CDTRSPRPHSPPGERAPRDTDARTVLVTRFAAEAELLAAAACRVVTVLPLDTVSAGELAAAVVRAADAATGWPALVPGLPEHAARLCADDLTAREIELLRLLADGLNTARIAQIQNYSESAVKKTLHALFRRMGVRNQQHAVARALRAGLI
ncbi:response regulator transcription factor, partial [Amycolatopsis sp. NPDC059090]|uniref:helix-turn-helix transcriptional regulator n=1 Tax=Amycolatopsis sp. NPDC059090 TaxID=3346723 RepID=UPI003671044D